MPPLRFRPFRTSSLPGDKREPTHWLKRPDALILYMLSCALAQHCFGQVESAPKDGQGTAWAFLASTWSNGGYREKARVLEGLAGVRSSRATAIYREALGGNDPLIAGRAAALAEKDRVTELLPEITHRLISEDNQYARIQLLVSVGRLGTETAAHLVLPSALEETQPVTGVAFGILKDLGAAAAPALSTVLEKSCPICRESAAYLFLENEKLPDGGALRQALNDQSSRVRSLAASALMERGDRTGADILRTAQHGADVEMRVRASISLYNEGDVQSQDLLLNDISKASLEFRTFAVREVIRRTGPRLGDMVITMAKQDRLWSVRNAALDGLSARAGDIQRIAGFLSDTEPSVRLFAATLLLKAGSRDRADPILRSEWSHASVGQKANILSALSESGVSTSIEQDLVDAALTENDTSVRAAAINVARNSGAMFSKLLPMLNTSDLSLTASVASALVTISPAGAATALDADYSSAKGEAAILRAGYFIRAREALQERAPQ